MDKINELADSLLTSIENKDKKHTAPYDTRAEIRNIKDGVAWVHIPGGVDETPVDLTMNANIGDIVQIRVSGGRAWITGNATAPPTDDYVARRAYTQAIQANEVAEVAKVEAISKPHIFYGSPDNTYDNVQKGDYLVDGDTGNTYKWSNGVWEIVTDYEYMTDLKIDSLNNTVFYAYSENSDGENLSFDDNQLQYRGVSISMDGERPESKEDYNWSLNPEWARKYADNYIGESDDNAIIIKSPDPNTYSKLYALAMLFYMGGIEQLRIGYDENRETYGVVAHDLFAFGNGAGIKFDNSSESSSRARFVCEIRNNGHLSLKMY